MKSTCCASNWLPQATGWSTLHRGHIVVETKMPPFCRWHFKCIFLNQNIWISIKISLKFVSRRSINKIPTLFQIMAWRRPGDKPLSETIMAWVTDAYMRHSASMIDYVIQHKYIYVETRLILTIKTNLKSVNNVLLLFVWIFWVANSPEKKDIYCHWYIPLMTCYITTNLCKSTHNSNKFVVNMLDL